MGLVSVHMEPQAAGCRGGVRGAPGIGPPRYHLSARKMWMVRGYGVATSCGPGDVCDRRCRIFEVERVNHMHGREGAPRWWRGCPENIPAGADTGVRWSGTGSAPSEAHPENSRISYKLGQFFLNWEGTLVTDLDIGKRLFLSG